VDLVRQRPGKAEVRPIMNEPSEHQPTAVKIEQGPRGVGANFFSSACLFLCGAFGPSGASFALVRFWYFHYILSCIAFQLTAGAHTTRRGNSYCACCN
jgi:hypothetical protein